MYAPLLLSEAVIGFWPALPDGTPNLDAPIWLGTCAENLRMNREQPKVDVTPSGSPFKRYQDLAVLHEISIERVWTVPGSTFAPWSPERDQRFVMNISWSDERLPGKCYQRTYYGVEWLNDDVNSKSVLESAENQKFRAEQLVED